jgi:uncharacterized protein (DUF1810 family)
MVAASFAKRSMHLDDPYDLKRFVDAQAAVFETVRAELLAGQKRTHWMWFIFPQIAGLGNSPTSRWFAIKSTDEARNFLDHPVLGARLRECTQIVNAVTGRSAYQIFGNPDCMKFHSCMTLFAQIAAGEEAIFRDALRLYFDGEMDRGTLDRLAS